MSITGLTMLMYDFIKTLRSRMSWLGCLSKCFVFYSWQTTCVFTFLTLSSCGVISEDSYENRIHGACGTHKHISSNVQMPLKSGDVDFGPYMAVLQRNIKAKWFPPKGQESKRVIVAFKVKDDGTLNNLRVEKSSSIADIDAAALRAVEDAAPFAPLPQGSAQEVDIQFTFDYNTLEHGKFKRL